jgi:hypothetical protein
MGPRSEQFGSEKHRSDLTMAERGFIGRITVPRPAEVRTDEQVPSNPPVAQLGEETAVALLEE